MRPLRLLIASSLLAATALGASAATAAPEASGPVTLADVGIPASDGVELVGDVHLPHATGRYPAVVDMEPYGRASDTSYLDEGYAHVNTDVRGSGKSGGALCLLCDREQQDAYDVVEWVARQPWSNGKVVLKGYSYSAITALLGAAKQPPHLRAVVAGHPPTDPYRDVLWHNGLFMQGFVDQWFAGQTGTQAVGLGPQPQYVDRKDQLFAVETRLTMLDGPLYQERSVLDKVARITVPVYMTSGWNDMYSRGDLQLLDALRGPKRLVMDASTHHGTGQAGHAGAPYSDAPLGAEASLNTPFPAGEVESWLDHFVKGKRNGADRLPALRFLDLGSRTWTDAPSWRSVGTRLTGYQLSGRRSGTAALSPNDGSLVKATPTGRDSYQDSYVYDPAAGSSVPMDKEGPDGFAPYLALDPSVDAAARPDLHLGPPGGAAAPGRAVRAGRLGRSPRPATWPTWRGWSTSRPTARPGSSPRRGCGRACARSTPGAAPPGGALPSRPPPAPGDARRDHGPAHGPVGHRLDRAGGPPPAGVPQQLRHPEPRAARLAGPQPRAPRRRPPGPAAARDPLSDRRPESRAVRPGHAAG